MQLKPAVQRGRHPAAHRAALQRAGGRHLQLAGPASARTSTACTPTPRRREYPAAAHKVATWLLQQMAAAGQRRVPGVPEQRHPEPGPGRAGLHLARQQERDQDAHRAARCAACPTATAARVDSDGDGLPDDLDNSRSRRQDATSFIADRDGDCFDDNFEVIARATRASRRERPRTRAAAIPPVPLTRNCVCRDTDGDGLRQFAEAYLQDARRPGGQRRRRRAGRDGGALRAGPADPQLGLDTDGDGIADDEEIRAGTDPTRPDRDFVRPRRPSSTTSSAEVQPDGSVCYDFAVSNLELVTPPNGAGAARRATISSRCGSPRRRRARCPPTTACGRRPAPGRSTTRRHPRARGS